MERTRVYDVLRSDEVALVSNRNGDLVTGMEVEANIKRLYSHGKSGIIVYGFAYEPKFRATFREFEKRLTDRLYEQPSAIPTTLLVKS